MGVRVFDDGARFRTAPLGGEGDREQESQDGEDSFDHIGFVYCLTGGKIILFGQTKEDNPAEKGENTPVRKNFHPPSRG